MSDDDADKTQIAPSSVPPKPEPDVDDGRTIIASSPVPPVDDDADGTMPPLALVDEVLDDAPEDAPEEDTSRTIIAAAPVPPVVTVPPVEEEEEPEVVEEPPVTVPPEPVEEPEVVEPPVTEPPAPIAEPEVSEPPVVTSPPEPDPEPAAPPTSAPPAAPIPTAPPAQDGGAVPIGTVINNNYAITQLISAGGMGEVFRGENTFTGDAVAIKIVLQSLAHDEKIAALFKREAKVLCGLSDQSIVRYYNFVRDAELDRFCLIMEFIDGIALSDHVKQVAQLTREEGHRLLRRLAGGLARAHAMDVVHRDLSPDNVMLRDGFIDEAVLIDFGIAKSSEMAESTLHGQLAGKFKYISPEQLGHFGGEIGPRTDIYGLGLLMAAALRGEPLDMGSSVVEAVDARRGIPDVNDIDMALRPLIAHMLEPNPADRPHSMTDVIGLLDDPTMIPEKYGRAEGIIPPGQQEVPQQSFVTSTGLQQPPGGQQQTGFGQQSMVPNYGGVDKSQTPFGASTGLNMGTQTGLNLAQPGQTMNQTQAPQNTGGGGIAGVVRWLVLLGLVAGGGYYVSQNPDLIFPPEEVAGEETLPDDPVANTPNGPLTRGSFLAGYHEGECGFAERIAAGPQAGTIATYSADPAVFDEMLPEFEALFDARPSVVINTLDAVQCPAADLAKILATRPGSAPILTLDSNVMESGGSIVGRLSDRRGRPVWLALITTQGGVYNLTDRLTEQADGSATFSFALNAPEGSDAQPQLLVAIAADAPLIAAAASTDGASAASVMPLIEAEVLGKDGAAGMTLGYFDLKP